MSITLATLALLASGVSPVAAAVPQGGQPAALKTTVVVLVGQPDTTKPTTPGVSIPTGTVIVSSIGNVPPKERFMRTRRELRNAYRLGKLDSTTFEDVTLTLNAEQELPPVTRAIAQKATLLSFDEDNAVYRVRLLENGKEVAAPQAVVKRGDWFITGGRDGDEAPYFFVLLRAASEDEVKEEARWLDISKPKLVDKVMPVYPEEARKARTEGVVVLDCLIGTDGAVKEAKPQEGADPLLVKAASEAVRQWRYEPARNTSGQPVAVNFTVTVSFWLN